MTVSNPSDFERNEVVGIPVSALATSLTSNIGAKIGVKPFGTSDLQVTQWIDNDQDGLPDELLFFVQLEPKGSSKYEFTLLKKQKLEERSVVAYSRFVPERTDDYAWENDKVAFRTFGPTAEKMVVENVPGGTLSSGIDLWLKKVNYSIIDKWYAGYLSNSNYYHQNRGEGYDPYHVGKSRGVGGIGIWNGEALLTSRNFTNYRIIASGPLRTVFELDYAPWSQYNVQETKKVTLDLGSNFSKFEISLSSEAAPNYTIGIQTHELAGTSELNPEQGIFRYWEPIHQSKLGVGVVIDPSFVEQSFVHKSNIPDQTQILVVTSSEHKVLTYYAGFGWSESGQVKNAADWDQMLSHKAEQAKNPLTIKLN